MSPLLSRTDKGILMTFGSGINGCLGHGDTNDVSEVCIYVLTVYCVRCCAMPFNYIVCSCVAKYAISMHVVQTVWFH